MDQTGKYNGIPALTPTVVHNYLRKIGSEWTGKGVAMELGCWLGASSVALLEGLVQAGYYLPYFAFDKWRANEEEVKHAKDKGFDLIDKQDLSSIFLKNVRKVYSKINLYRGNIHNTVKRFSDYPIEICIFDAPKRKVVFNIAVNTLSPYWIPGVTVLGLLDYHFHRTKPKQIAERLMAPVEFIKKNRDCFELMADWPDTCSCAFFKYTKKLNHAMDSK